jgi:hypothetical protein
MLAPDASKLADDCWRVQVTNARLQGCTATEVTATSRKRPDASCRHPDREQHRIRDGRAPRAYSEVAHQASKSCSLRWTNACALGAGGVSPPWFTEPHRQGSATFAMDERMCTRSGGRQPPVVHGNARARAWRNCSGDIRPPHWRAPAQLRYHHIHGGLTRGALAPGESLPACAWRFPLHARSPNHGGLTPAALALGESPPACTWRFPLHARSRNHGGLTPAALASECERLSAKLRLLRCTNAHASGAGASAPRGSRNCTGKGVRLLRWTNAHAPGAGGVSPPWLAVTHFQGLRANVGAIADRASADPDAVAVLHPRQHPRRAGARRSCVG